MVPSLPPTKRAGLPPFDDLQKLFAGNVVGSGDAANCACKVYHRQRVFIFCVLVHQCHYQRCDAFLLLISVIILLFAGPPAVLTKLVINTF